MHAKIILTLAATLLFFSCKTDYPGQEAVTRAPDAPVPVEVIAISPTTEPIPIEAGGTIGAKTEARLSFKIGGVVDRMYAREGQYVRRGTVLAKLKTTEVDAQVAKATQARDKARRDVDRVTKLYEEQAATLEQKEGLTTALEVAESDLEIAGFNRKYATITAPVSGRIIRKMAEAGELVAPGTPLYFLAGEGADDFVLRINVADRDLLNIQLDDRALVDLDAYPDQPVPAKVTEIAAAADPRTGSFQIELTLDGQGRTLRSGFVGRAKVYPSKTPEYYRIPTQAIVEGEGKHVRIFVPDAEGKAREKTIRFTRLLNEAVIVPASELAGVDQVITRGSHYLTDGSKIDFKELKR
ncbi:efflux RND transporter periplasmic adaptor subunit [Neolewinella antarctica]|uniref:RND family efflux transporter MFP subunit n=1 Tax=Neolewinella antarctica TaxID=442734 RepID=A0ABX0X8V0_9BACT|nr:efflux RND transporter periplasmic adaptor subunit [Neolewinella antarctica]NJC25646.1 RND family efflux transporter MFP subunit [Neolewinella antarctica]